MHRALFLALAFIALNPACSRAQTIAISGHAGGGTFTQQLDVPIGSPFALGVWIDPAGHGSQAVEFAYTDLAAIRPGVIQIGLIPIVPMPILPPCEQAQCVFGFGTCVDPAVPLELVRFEYIDLGGFTGSDVVLTPGPAQPSSFGGEPGFLDCDDRLVPLTVGGTTGGVTGAGVVFRGGAMVLNPTPLVVSNEGHRFGRLKAAYR